MAAVVPEPGSPPSTPAASCGSKYGSWPETVRRYAGIQIVVTCSWVVAVLWWVLLGRGALTMLAPTVLTPIGALCFGRVLRVSFLRRRVAVGALIGHALVAGAMTLLLLAQFEPGVYLMGTRIDELPSFPGGLGCLLLGLPMMTWGLLRLLRIVTGPWHGHAERTLWACLAVIGASLLLQVLVAAMDVPGPGQHELTAELFVVLGLIAGGAGVLLVLMNTLVRLRRACEPIARVIWTDANGVRLATVELRGGQSLVCEQGRAALESTLELERRLSRAGYGRC